MLTVTYPIACTSCGETLQGADVQGLCPHCTHTVEETLRLVGVDSSMNIGADVPCLRCDYNLRTMSVGGLCPECGRPVINSLRPDDLRGADRAWLKRVRSGVTLIMTSTLVGGLIYLLSFIVMIGSSPGLNDLNPLVGTFISIVLWILFCIGMFKATASDPSISRLGLSNFYRDMARFCALIPILTWVAAWYAIWPLSSVPGVPFGAMLKMTKILSAISMFLGGFCAIGLFVCVRRLFHRARRNGLRRLANVELSLVSCVIALAPVGLMILSYALPPISPSILRIASSRPTKPLPGAKVTSLAPNLTVEDYSQAEQPVTTRSTPAGLTPIGTTTLTGPSFFVPSRFILFVFTMAVTSSILGLVVLSKARRLLAEVLAIQTV